MPILARKKLGEAQERLAEMGDGHALALQHAAKRAEQLQAEVKERDGLLKTSQACGCLRVHATLPATEMLELVLGNLVQTQSFFGKVCVYAVPSATAYS